MKQGLQIRQSQNLVMTPQLTESIKILQLSNLELIPYIATELEQNPFLERDDNDTPEENTTTPDPEDDNNNDTKITSVDKLPEKWEDDEVSPAIYESDRLIYNNAGSGKESSGNSENALENIAGQEITLREYIINQINADIKDQAQRITALYLTEFIDENGYITSDTANFATNLQCTSQQIENVISTLQKFDPPGIFARNLAECLALQLKDRNRLDPAMQILLDNLDLMAKCDFKALKKLCAVDDEDLKAMFLEIKALNPKVGSNFSQEKLQILQPDIFLKKDNKNNWLLELNNDALPRILINRRYYAKIEQQVHDKDSKKFLHEKWNTANFLAKALDQRANTILKVATEIVAQQNNFFQHGIHHLKPLIIADIASNVDMHESTISRVINGKYMATHMGTYELKYFFSSGLTSSGAGGEDISSKRIKFMIKQLVDEENPKKILSDDKIAAILKTKGINVARRTIMKYREAMHIASSVQRRREKEMV